LCGGGGRLGSLSEAAGTEYGSEEDDEQGRFYAHLISSDDKNDGIILPLTARYARLDIYDLPVINEDQLR
jgi:hypothetical protein